MLKRLAILGLLLLVSILAPIPGQTTARPSEGSGNTNSNSQNQNGVPNPLVSVAKSQPPENAEHTGEVAAKETEHSVTLTSVPPLTISAKKKTFLDYVYEWGPWFFGLFLAIAGGIQLRLLRVTWKAIQEQKAETTTQTGILKDSVAAAQKSADAAMAQIQLIKDKERGRLRIEFGKVDVAGDPGDDGCYQVPFTVFLDGATQVSIVEQSCFVGISEGGNGTTDHQAWRTMAVPGTITPEDRIFKASMLLLTHEVPYVEPFIDPDMVRVALTREDKLHIFARAFIKYEDLFGGIWEARFNKMWRYNSNFSTDNSIDLSHGFWTSVGDNGEYKAEKQPQNPN